MKINLLLHYRYYNEKFQEIIADTLLERDEVNKVIIPEGNKWEGVCKEGGKIHIPSNPDFVESYNINQLIPLSRTFMEKMSSHILICMSMLKREAYFDVYEYSEGRNKINKYIRFWYNFFIKENINFFFARYMGHHIFEYMIYAVAKEMGIPTIVFWGDEWGSSVDKIANPIKNKYLELCEAKERVILDDKDEKYLTRHMHFGENREVLNQKTENAEWKECFKFAKSRLNLRNFIYSFYSVSQYKLHGKREGNINYINYAKERKTFLLKYWIRAYSKYLHRETLIKYNKRAEYPTFNKPFIYYALQTEPELALTPLAGVFDNQMFALHILSSCAEDFGLDIYVKEHPYSHWREKGFYDKILEFHNIKLIKTTVNTYELIEKAIATATFSGSCALEGVIRGTPSLLFACVNWNGLPGSYYITDINDCKCAIKEIMAGKVDITMEKIRWYLKARELGSFKGKHKNNLEVLEESFGVYQEDAVREVDFILERIRECGVL